MRALGTNPTEAEVHRLCQDYMKKDDRISFDTFLPILQSVSSKKITDTVEDFVEGLRHFDKDGNGFITSAELRHLLTSMYLALIVILMHPKGQTISKANYGALNFPKKRTKHTILSRKDAEDSEFRSFFGRIEEVIYIAFEMY